MGSKKPSVCTLCETSHWSYQGCDTKGVEVRPWVREMLTPKVAVAEGARPVSSVSKAKAKAVAVEAAESGFHCEVCNQSIPRPKRGPEPKFCSNACRMKASRKKS